MNSASHVELIWESAGTDEPGDQRADHVSDAMPPGYWAIGPIGHDLWSLDLVIHDDKGREIECRSFGDHLSEADAKRRAARVEARRPLDLSDLSDPEAGQ